MLPFQPSPHESVIVSVHEVAVAGGADTEPENGEPPDAMNEPPHESDQPTSPGYMPPPTVSMGPVGDATGGGGEGDGGGGDAAGGVTEKVVVNGPEPDGIVNVWPKAVSVLPFQPSPHESVIESEHEAVAGADTEPENGAPPDARNEAPHASDQLTSDG